MGAEEFVRPEFAGSVSAARSRVTELVHERSLGSGGLATVDVFRDPASGERFVIKTTRATSDEAEQVIAAAHIRSCC